MLPPLALFALSIMAQSESFCPQEDIRDTGCRGPKDRLYANPLNCRTFIHCTVNSNGITGTPIIRGYPAGLEWNDEVKLCDYPFDSTSCDSGSQ
jgi:hypothetical protein